MGRSTMQGWLPKMLCLYRLEILHQCVLHIHVPCSECIEMTFCIIRHHEMSLSISILGGIVHKWTLQFSAFSIADLFIFCKMRSLCNSPGKRLKSSCPLFKTLSPHCRLIVCSSLQVA